MFGVDGWLGSSTHRALTWKSLCVPSRDGDTHSCSLVFLQQTADCQLFLSLLRGFDLLRQLLCTLFDRWQSTCVSECFCRGEYCDISCSWLDLQLIAI